MSQPSAGTATLATFGEGTGEMKRLRSAYLRAVREAHPDRKGGSVEAFVRVQKEYRSAHAKLSGGGAAPEKRDVACVLQMAVASAIKSVWEEKGCFVAHIECSRPRIMRCVSGRKGARRQVANGTPFEFYSPSPLAVFRAYVTGVASVLAGLFPDPYSFAVAVVASLPSSIYSVVRHVNVLRPGFINFSIAHNNLRDCEQPSAAAGGREATRASFVQCPICGADFAAGRGIRQHLQSKRHSLTGEDLQNAVDAVRQRQTVLSTFSGYAGGTTSGTRAATVAGSLDLGLIAARDGDLESLRLMVEAGWEAASVFDRNGSCALHFAAGSGHIAVVSYLMEVGVDINMAVETGRADGRTALHWACRNGHLATVKWLLSHGAVYCTTTDGTTPFHWAAWQGHRHICDWLVATEGEAAARTLNKYGCNAMHWCALSGNVEMCSYIAGFGVDPTQANTQGHAAVHKAAWRGQVGVCVWLKEEVKLCRESFAQIDRHGYTPADIARLAGHSAMQQWLEDVVGGGTCAGAAGAGATGK